MCKKVKTQNTTVVRIGRGLTIIALFFAITLSCIAQLTEQTVRRIIREEFEPVKLDVAEMKGKMATKDDITMMERQISEIAGQVSKIEGQMDAMATKDNLITVRDEIHSLYRWIFAMWITIILAVFGIPYLYGRADREKVKQLEADVRELIKLKADVEALKAIKEAEERRRETARRIAEEKPEFEEAYKMVGLL